MSKFDFTSEEFINSRAPKFKDMFEEEGIQASLADWKAFLRHFYTSPDLQKRRVKGWLLYFWVGSFSALIIFGLLVSILGATQQELPLVYDVLAGIGAIVVSGLLAWAICNQLRDVLKRLDRWEDPKKMSRAARKYFAGDA